VSLSNFEVLSEVLVSAPVGGGKAVLAEVLQLSVEVSSLLLESSSSTKLRVNLDFILTKDQQLVSHHSSL